MKHIVLGAALALLAGLPARAESPAPVQQLTDELQKLLDKGERERVADPWFLRDLREVVEKYRDPWRKSILKEGFDGRDSALAKPWSVKEGDFRVDWRYGLRSVVRPAQATAPAPAPAASGDGETRKPQGEDVARALVGLLGQALGTNQKPDSGAAPAPAAPPAQAVDSGRALVLAEVPITNAFDIEVELSARATGAGEAGGLQLGVYQGRDQLAGYRLVLTPDSETKLSLISVSSSGGTSVVELYREALPLADTEARALRWTRDPAGNMVVRYEGKAIMRVADRRFGDPFDGLLVLNQGGDYALRRVTIEGTE